MFININIKGILFNGLHSFVLLPCNYYYKLDAYTEINYLTIFFISLEWISNSFFVLFPGLNMTINSHSSSSVLSAHYSPVEPRLSVLNTIPHPGLTHPSHASLPSPRSEPIAGPSGLPPVQQVPLVSNNIFYTVGKLQRF